MDKTNLGSRNWLCCRIVRASAIAEADATMQVIKIRATLAVNLKSELIVCIHRINHDGQYLKSFNIVVFSATNKVSSESLGAIISKIFRFIDKIIVGIQV